MYELFSYLCNAPRTGLDKRYISSYYYYYHYYYSLRVRPHKHSNVKSRIFIR